MSGSNRFVFDTSTLVSAALFKRSTPSTAIDVAQSRGVVLLSLETTFEIADVLRRPKFERYLTSDDCDEFLLTLIEEASFICIDQTIRACRDPDDNKFLEVAVSGGASHIVTGDQDLLVLHPFRGIAIVTPAQFIAALSQS